MPVQPTEAVSRATGVVDAEGQPPDKDRLGTRSNSQSKPPSIIIPRINTQNYRGFVLDPHMDSSLLQYLGTG
ncbi:hypothetical protein BaRGS_00010458 [Batillaria attramentaria]|uniref:Uncharacterized protein n=1 Tax=Batillaria attramentaria TaxID=370345 RepID=A0ABD0LGE9_9CAEN